MDCLLCLLAKLASVILRFKEEQLELNFKLNFIVGQKLSHVCQSTDYKNQKCLNLLQSSIHFLFLQVTLQYLNKLNVIVQL